MKLTLLIVILQAEHVSHENLLGDELLICRNDEIPCRQAQNILCVQEAEVCYRDIVCDKYRGVEYCDPNAIKDDDNFKLCVNSPFWWVPSRDQPTICLHPTRICDDTPDFPDESDEGKCNLECSSNNICYEHHCHAIEGYESEIQEHCYCPEGYRECLVARSQGYHHCIKQDNVCKPDILCDQKCEDGACTCKDGWDLYNKTLCKVTRDLESNEPDFTILKVTNGVLTENTLENVRLSEYVVSKGSDNVTIGFADAFDREACFYLPVNKKVMCLREENDRWIINELKTKMENKIRGLYHNYVTGDFYYDTPKGIWICNSPDENFIQTYCAVVIDHSPVEDTTGSSLSVDPINGLLFFIRKLGVDSGGANFAIYSALLNGDNQRRIYSYKYQTTTGIELFAPHLDGLINDPASHKVYWLHSTENDPVIAIQSIAYNGDISTLSTCTFEIRNKKPNLRHYKINGIHYVIDIAWGDIYKIDITNCKDVPEVTKLEESIHYISFLHKQVEHLPKNPCHCDQLCFTRVHPPKGDLEAKCFCSFGYVYNDERKKCESLTDKEVSLFIEERLEIFSPLYGKQYKWGSKYFFQDLRGIPSNSLAWIDKSGELQLLIAWPRYGLVMHNLHNHKRDNVLTYDVHGTVRVAVDHSNQVVFWSTSRDIMATSYSENAPNDAVNHYRLIKGNLICEFCDVFGLHYNAAATSLYIWSKSIDRNIIELYVYNRGHFFRAAYLDSFNMKARYSFVFCNEKFNLLVDSGKLTLFQLEVSNFAKYYNLTHTISVFDIEVYFTKTAFDKDYDTSGSLFCHPNYGALVVLTDDNGAEVFNFETNDILDEFNLSVRPSTAVVATKINEDYTQKCKSAHIQHLEGHEILCFCNDGYRVSGSGLNVKCKKSKDYDNIQDYCGAYHFKCGSHECKPMNLKCNQILDCHDGSDEENCDQCAPNQWACLSKKQCISIDKRCDYSIDCHDFSDELNCQHTNCPEGFKACKDTADNQRTLCYDPNYLNNYTEKALCSLQGIKNTDPDFMVTTAKYFYPYHGEGNVPPFYRAGVNDQVHLAYAGHNFVGGKVIFLVLDENFDHASHPIVDLGFNHFSESTFWSVPSLPRKLTTNDLKIKRFRYSKTFGTSYFQTSGPDAIWREQYSDIPQSATLLYLARKGETIISMDLVDCFDAIFALLSRSNGYTVIKLPGYDYRAHKGYEYTIDESGEVIQMIVNVDRVCIVVNQSGPYIVLCKDHNISSKWVNKGKFTEDFVKIAFGKTGVLYFMLGYITANGEYEMEISFDLENRSRVKRPGAAIFDSTFAEADVIPYPSECEVNPCKAAATKKETDETHLIGPENGGCEDVCDWNSEGKGMKYVTCSCSDTTKNKLRPDNRTCQPATYSCENDFKGTYTSEPMWSCSKTHECIGITQVCDGIQNCVHGEDELYCSGWLKLQGLSNGNFYTPCPKEFYKCQNGQCVYETTITWLDNSNEDIPSGCVDNTHIFMEEDYPKELFCVHRTDSPNCGEEEIIRVKTELRTNPDDYDTDYDIIKEIIDYGCDMQTEWTCSNDECIHVERLCDGVFDCKDGSDESICNSCSGDAFFCGASIDYGNCVPKSAVCNRKIDCTNARDEKTADDGGVCEFQVDLSDICDFEDYWNAATQKCEKVTHDECSTYFFPCSQICTVVNTAPQCFCNLNRYTQPSPQSQSCHPKTDIKPFIIFANQKQFQLIDNILPHTELQPTKSIELSSHHRNVVALDFNYRLNRFYWSVVGHGKEFKNVGMLNFVDVANISDYASYPEELFKNSDVKKLILPYHEQIDSVAIDWVTNNLYCTDKLGAHITVMTKDGYFVKTLADKNSGTDHAKKIMNPRALAFYQAQGLLYFSDWGEYAPHLGRIGMDGSNATVLLENSLAAAEGSVRIGWPNDIVIDNTASTRQFDGDWSSEPNIYWCDAKFDYIARANLDFTKYHLIYKATTVIHIFSMTLFGDYIYFTDWKNGLAIRRVNKFCNKENCVPEYVSQLLTNKPMALVVIHPLKQPPLPNTAICDELNCDDNQLCLLSPVVNTVTWTRKVEAKCVCGDNFISRDGKCVANCAGPHSHMCDDGFCVQTFMIGDGIPNCVNDETNEWKDRNLCASHSQRFFTCTNTTQLVLSGKSSKPKGYCIAAVSVCDGIPDCLDGSDEIDCEEFECINERHKCTGDKDKGKCISAKSVCNGHIDCESRSDESQCDCRNGQVNCRSSHTAGHRCVPVEVACENEYSCIKQPHCDPVKCQPHQFKCEKSNQCGIRCNGVMECSHGEDEIGCPNLTHECGPGVNFVCKSETVSYCIPDHWKCDGAPDCINSEDEDSEICGDVNSCVSGIFCDGECLDPIKVCDMVQDCTDRKDEINCYPCLVESQFSCKRVDATITCISQDQVCDDIKDCPGGDDEDPSLCSKTKCSDGMLNCKGDHAECVVPKSGINTTLLCDGKWDCRNGQDEEGCQVDIIRTIFARDGTTSCYTRNEAPFRPNWGLERLDETDARPCGDDSCTTFKDTLDKCYYYQNLISGKFVYDLIEFYSQNPCVTRTHCEQLCLPTEPERDFSDEILKTTPIHIGMDITSWQKYVYTYTCGCVNGYTAKLDDSSRCVPDEKYLGYDFVLQSNHKSNILVQRAHNIDRDGVINVFMGPYHAENYDDISFTSFQVDLRRKRFFFLSKEVGKIHVSRSLESESYPYFPPHSEDASFGDAMPLVEHDYSTIQTPFKIEKMLYIMELDLMLLVRADFRQGKLSWLNLNNGYIAISKVILRLITKAVAYMIRHCGSRQLALLLVSTGTELLAIQLSEEDLFKDPRHMILYQSTVSDRCDINSIVVDPYKCRVYFSNDVDVSIRFLSAESIVNRDVNIVRSTVPRVLASLYPYTYRKMNSDGSHPLTKPYITNPTVEMTIFENTIYAIIKDKVDLSLHNFVAVSTLTGHVTLLTSLDAYDPRGISIAPWMATSSRLKEQVETLYNHGCKEKCKMTLCLMENNSIEKTKCVDPSLLDGHQAQLSCDHASEHDDEWKISLCYREAQPFQAKQAISGTIVFVIIIVILVGFGLTYLHRLRSNRYIQVPQSTNPSESALVGLETYDETEMNDTTWDTEIPPTEFRNELFDDLNVKSRRDPHSSDVTDLVKIGEKENLLDNDELQIHYE